MSELFGILNVNKPAGITSRDAVNVVQRLVRPAKVGHAGTLDPMATGVLLVCVGGATRLISLLQEAPKTYVSEFQLGQTSDTDDSTGEVVKKDGTAPPSREDIESELQKFCGQIQQVPPAYSAVKVDGQRSYRLAREGQEVTLQAKTVTVHSIELLHYEWPSVTVSIECGSGTYIRSIARDLGEALRVGGLMSALQRTKIGRFSVTSGVDPDQVTADTLADALQNPIGVVDHLPRYVCSAKEEAGLRTGNRLTVDPVRLHEPPGIAKPSESESGKAGESKIALVNADESRLLAMAELCQPNQLQPRQVFVPGTSGV